MKAAPIKITMPAVKASRAGENTNHDTPANEARRGARSSGSSRAQAIRSKPGAASTAGALSTNAITRCSFV